jgi:hypothetical protein
MKIELKENEILGLRTVNDDLTSYHGFKNPELGIVECADWNTEKCCGGGIHFLPWGNGDWSLLNKSKWQIIKVNSKIVVDIDAQKSKAPAVEVLYTGEMAEAVCTVLTHPNRPVDEKKGDNYSTAASSGNSSKAASSGYSSTAASSGYSSTAASSGNSSTAASSGDYSTAASSGNSSTAASSGYSSKAASSGDSSTAASSGNSSTAASSGYSSTAASSGYDTIAMAAGINCIVKAGKNGCFATAYYDSKTKRNKIVVGYVGRNGIKPDVYYKLNSKGKYEVVK